MPKDSTIRRWSHGRVRRIIAKDTRKAVAGLLSELRKVPDYPKAAGLPAGSAEETEFINRVAKDIADDLSGPGLAEYAKLAGSKDIEELTTSDIIQQARSKAK